MYRVTPRVVCAVVITLLAWPLARGLSTAQQITLQSSTTQSGQMQVLVIGESVFTSSAQGAVALTEEDIVIIDAQYLYRVTAQGITAEPRAGTCVCLPQRCCCGPLGTPCQWCPGLDPC